ncbi:MAG: hypothetical protein IKC46_13690 [Lachnospiraceae bacterium]|nr:hypothetical protein [Lachnospiraceae bacterium]
MNCLFILVLLGCCGRGRMCQMDRCSCQRACETVCDRSCERNCERSCEHRCEPVYEHVCETRREPACECSCESSCEQQERTCQHTCKEECTGGCIEPRGMRYDTDMCSYGRMDTVPEMKSYTARPFPMYPESCGCSD